MRAVIELQFEFDPQKVDPAALTGDLLQRLLIEFPNVFWQCSNFHTEAVAATPARGGSKQRGDKKL